MSNLNQTHVALGLEPVGWVAKEPQRNPQQGNVGVRSSPQPYILILSSYHETESPTDHLAGDWARRAYPEASEPVT